MNGCCVAQAAESAKESEVIMRKLQELQKLVDETHSYICQKLSPYSKPEPASEAPKGVERANMSPYFGELRECIDSIERRINFIYSVVKDSEL